MERFDAVWMYMVRTMMYLPGIILGLTVHEYCHALVAHWCGDNTSKEQGRVSLNPLKHIDPYGFIMLIVAGFGWAKPVHFNEQNLRNPRTDVIKIAIAGPLSNALIAMLLSLILASITDTASIAGYDKTGLAFINVLRYAIYINWGLFVFNLIPLPPLDGSHLLFYPFRKYPVLYESIYRYGSLLLFGIIIFSIISKTNLIPIGKVMESLYYGFLDIIGYK
jgi:Zn-dependent protease